MADNSTLPKRSRKVRRSLTERLKPYRDFPLSAYVSGAWMKKIRGKNYFFGKWGSVRDEKPKRLPEDGWKVALELYE
jgi:hypothetical protein